MHAKTSETSNIIASSLFDVNKYETRIGLEKNIAKNLPPVANIGIPALFAIISVPETVVPPFNELETTYAKSLLEVFIGKLLLISPNSEISVSLNPALIFPPEIAMVAGITPCRNSKKRSNSTTFIKLEKRKTIFNS